ncbi:uncharacterized protein BDR25DRAFT_298756 [Lindgomyces ingoldianus]|uniref:Uncharacterized protein n=1 Tax=Lindgomyces ingoldianus TaxID=673940 RepID=A0ACB6Q855_9PLEO|nr:uncharacterized protein BDR25DRAFT_298756 [Lindgomyces ingoldianus]KAF2463035.1 hypothetical protein BDR25DRAFT_298756 [Lindgomyces ingoldianus]
MRFFSNIFAGAALVSATLGLTIDSYPSTVEVGKSYDIKYSPAGTAATTFILRKGDPKALGTIGTLTTSATGGTFKWTVDPSLANGDDYALEVQQGNADPNFTGLIKVIGSTASASSSAVSSVSSTTSASSAKSSGSTLATSASASVSSSAGGNSTISVPTLSSTAHSSGSASATGAKSTSGSPTTGGGAPRNTGAASTLGSSPLALIFGAVAAMAYLN